MKLYDCKQIAEYLGCTSESVQDKARRLNLQAWKLQGDKRHYFNDEQVYQMKAMQVENYRVEIIRITKEYEYFESKINRPRNTYGTHSHFNRIKSGAEMRQKKLEL
jgi:hypothetical protein